MKVEESYGFEAALEIDDAVWRVMPKIQARLLKSMAGADSGIEALFECFTTKLHLDGFVFRAERDVDARGFRVLVEGCPWHDSMVKSGREHLSDKVGARICSTECSMWAAEFGENIGFELQSRICRGADLCVHYFCEVGDRVSK